ncbi:hypothetical protein AALP_AA3G277100 [Arabis alpina]|uniref:poly(A)-specific ribonuclease n=1 Tax=Arabis alpina TaxID=50452 RepID=A0A087HC43_ARAAL|nr:hypothetical protein AALP_AA3G277100 [Arabis alpina]
MATNREIWNWNKEEELTSMKECLKASSYIAIDTEFPGCLKESPMDANEADRYSDMRFNVERTKLIQLGLTLLGSDGKNRGTWEVNFSDFDVRRDKKNDKSISFLRRNGLNFDKIREEGIPMEDFFKQFSKMLNKQMSWVTFDGSYDMAYLFKGLTGVKSLPPTSQRFDETVERLVGYVFDAKDIAGLCKGLSSCYGLQRVADELQIKRLGTAHHAGSDSELTARVYIKMALMVHRDLSKRKRSESDQQQPQHIHQERVLQKKMRFRTEQEQLLHQELMIQDKYKIMMSLRAAQQHHHLQEVLITTRNYVPTPPMIFAAYSYIIPVVPMR